MHILWYKLQGTIGVKIQLFRQRYQPWGLLLLVGVAAWFFVQEVHLETQEDGAAPVVQYHNMQELELLVKVENARYTEEGLPVVKDNEPSGEQPDNPGGEMEPGEITSYPALYAAKRTVEELPQESRVCYLTFDDGPSENTLKVLEILKRYDAKATFFLIGENITEETAPIVKQILAEGHAVGIHANVHSYEKLYRSADSFLADYESLAKRLREEFGIETALFRFPGGSACTYLKGQGKSLIRQMHARGFVCFDWNVSGEDSVGKPTVASIQKNVFRDVFRYRLPVVLLHDSPQTPTTVEALPAILERIAEEGYRFASLAAAEEYIFPKNRE